MYKSRLLVGLLVPLLLAPLAAGGDDAKPAPDPADAAAKFLSGWAVPQGADKDAVTGFPRRIQRSQDGAVMVLIPAGTFQMGAVPGDASAEADEKPRHDVTILSAYYLDETEVTVGMWKKYVASVGGTVRADPLNSATDVEPMDDVSWNEVQAYLKWAPASLPTEAQWERAAKGGHDEFTFPWGVSDDEKRRNGVGRGDGFDRHAPVKSFDANDYGLFDLGGNVWEWCADGYDKDYYATSPATDPQGPQTASSRVIRGGAYYGTVPFLRVSYRDFYAPTYSFEGIGFRCARSLADVGPGDAKPPEAPVPPAPAPAPATAAPRAVPALPGWAAREGAENDATTGHPKRVTRTKDGAAMVLVPAGTFQMGAVPSDEEAAADEKPRHEVTLSKAFYLDEHEVTNEQFEAFVAATGWKTTAETEGKGYAADAVGDWKLTDGASWKAPLPGGGRPPDWAKHAVVLVSWRDANAYAEWAGVALPTEAQFERALRGGREDQKFPWGAESLPSKLVGNFADASAKRAFPTWKVLDGYDDGFARTAPSKSFGSNEYGVYDLSGNVWEWCADGYDKDYYARSPALDPPGSASAPTRVARGGSWLKTGPYLRASARSSVAPEGCGADLGFRCAKTLP